MSNYSITIKANISSKMFLASFSGHGDFLKILVFREPPPWVDDSKNIWVAQYQLAYRAFCAIISKYSIREDNKWPCRSTNFFCPSSGWYCRALTHLPLYYICRLLTQNARYACWNWATHIFLESSTKGGGSPKNRFFLFYPSKKKDKNTF